jgi:hypothetical protein
LGEEPKRALKPKPALFVPRDDNQIALARLIGAKSETALARFEVFALRQSTFLVCFRVYSFRSEAAVVYK